MSELSVMREQAEKLKKEIDDVRHRGRTTYAQIKDQYGFKGGRAKVYDSLMKNIRKLDRQQQLQVV